MESVIHDESPVNTNPNALSDEFPELLRFYYSRLFPFGPFFKWLSYDNVSGKDVARVTGLGAAGAGDEAGAGRGPGMGLQGSYVSRREFSFTLEDDVYIRYQSFSSAAELEAEIKKKRPFKIDIGAVYNAPPKDHKTIPAGVFQPLEKELVFDIDMTDYDEVRTCCSGADICSKCWPFMTIAVRVLDAALREDFGFEHLLWVYSGRRGIHCWVCDPRARALTQAGRSAVAEYLNVIHGSASSDRKVFMSTPLHPSMERAIGIVAEYFDELVLEDQGLFANAEKWDTVLPLISDGGAREGIRSTLVDMDGANPGGVWDGIKAMYEENDYRIADLYEIMLQFAYPRLDIHVSKGLNHLLKSPFCVHPKTGRVCVPFNPAQADNFDPMAVPTVSQLVQELTQAQKDAAVARVHAQQHQDLTGSAVVDMEIAALSSSAPPSAPGKLPDAAYKHTSLKPYFEFFENDFLLKLSTSLREFSEAAQVSAGNFTF